MKNLDLATYGVEEMNEAQMQNVDGGITPLPKGDNVFENIKWIYDNFPSEPTVSDAVKNGTSLSTAAIAGATGGIR